MFLFVISDATMYFVFELGAQTQLYFKNECYIAQQTLHRINSCTKPHLKLNHDLNSPNP